MVEISPEMEDLETSPDTAPAVGATESSVDKSPPLSKYTIYEEVEYESSPGVWQKGTVKTPGEKTVMVYDRSNKTMLIPITKSENIRKL